MAQVMEPTEVKQQIATAEIPDSATQILKEQPAESMVVEKKKRTIPNWALPAGAILVLVALLGWWLHARQFESTDDAQIEGHIHAISARISGTVVYINPKVENNQYVEAGTLLLELDPNDYQAALEHARADLTTREATARSAGVNVPITNVSAFSQLRLAQAAHEEALAAVNAEQANLAAAQHKVVQDEALYARAERDRVRYEALVEKKEISCSEYDARATEATAAAQALESDRAAVTSAQQKIVQARSLVAQRQAQIEIARTAPQQLIDARARSQSSAGLADQARADVRTAELNLGYTRIYAPVSGVIGRKTVEVGHRVQPGQSLLALVPLDDIWVTADFKETQLKLMRPGQAVNVHVDAFDRDYKGVIENLPGAAGTLFSLLPPENASGNYVKVVQRLPVRIHFDRDQDPQRLLRPGMSVEAKVSVR
jgi:membrane fusion protein (multidrug efflux system)